MTAEARALLSERPRQVRRSGPYAAAVCVTGGYDPDDWFRFLETEGGRPDAATLRRRAEVKQRCARCPALAQCRADFWGEPFGIVAGTEPSERGFCGSPSNRRLAVVPDPGNTSGPDPEAGPLG